MKNNSNCYYTISMKVIMKLSPFDQAMKAIGEVMYPGPQIKEGTKTALNISLGKLTFASKLSKDQRNLFEIHMAIREITRLVEDIETLQPVWEQARPVFQYTLLS